MVRFYCTVCKKVKRVRQLPTRIKNEFSDFPADRIGECNKHRFPARKSIQVSQFNRSGQIQESRLIMLNKQNKPIIGDCEVKDGHTNVEVWLTEPGHIYMCASCIEEQEVLKVRNEAAQNLVNSFRQHDTVMEVKTEIWNAEQIPLMELKAAIQQNDAIPESEKSHVFIQECKVHVEKFDSLIFNARKQLNDMENARNAWQVNGQEAYGKLRTELRDKFRQFDMNYKPATVKEIKPKAVKSPAMSAKQKASTRIGSR